MSGNRIGSRTLAGIAGELSERDLAVLESVSEFRLLSAPQIQALHFFDHASELAATRASRRVLERLSRDRLLVRLQRRIGGVRAGSASFVYALGPVGHRVLGGDSSRRWREPSPAFVDHTLAAAQIVVDLTAASREGDAELVHYQCEPGCWRQLTSALTGTETLKPDLHIVTATDEHELWWFVEVDLATASGAAVAAKCRVYHRYWTAGIEQDRHGAFPKVLWITPNEQRREFIAKTISKTRGINGDLFDTTTTEESTAVLAGDRT